MSSLSKTFALASFFKILYDKRKKDIVSKNRINGAYISSSEVEFITSINNAIISLEYFKNKIFSNESYFGEDDIYIPNLVVGYTSSIFNNSKYCKILKNLELSIENSKDFNFFISGNSINKYMKKCNSFSRLLKDLENEIREKLNDIKVIDLTQLNDLSRSISVYKQIIKVCDFYNNYLKEYTKTLDSIIIKIK